MHSSIASICFSILLIKLRPKERSSAQLSCARRFSSVRASDLQSRCPSNPPELLKRVSNLGAHDGQPMISGFLRLDKCAERVRIRSFDLESELLRYQLCQPAIVRVGATEALPAHCLRDLAHGRLVMVKPVMLAKQIAPRLRHLRSYCNKRIAIILRGCGLRRQFTHPNLHMSAQPNRDFMSASSRGRSEKLFM